MGMLIKVVEKWIEGKRFGSGQLRTDGKNLFSYRLKIGRTRKKRKEFIDYSEECGMKMYVTTANHVYEAKLYITKVIAEDLRKYHIKLSYPVSWHQYRTTITLHDYLPDIDCYDDVVQKNTYYINVRSVDLDHPNVLYFLNAHAYDYLKVLEKYPRIISPEGLY
jgi:hypothetical protein